MHRRRILSLLPSATETVCALDLADCLVGRSHECDYPPAVRQLPVCTEARIDSQSASAAIDGSVKSLLHRGLSIYRVNMAELRELKPDFILTQAQCDVCAVSLADLEHALAGWIGQPPRVISAAPMRLGEVWESIRCVANAVGVSARGLNLVADLQKRVDSIAIRTRVVGEKLSVACLEWLDPLMTAGNWVPELVEFAGGRNLLSKEGEHSFWLEWETLRQHDPEFLIIMPCGFDLDRTRQEMPALSGCRGWNQLRSVRDRQVFLTDGNHFFNRPGPRLVESAEILAEILHPDLFHFGHEGTGWERWSPPR